MYNQTMYNGTDYYNISCVTWINVDVCEEVYTHFIIIMCCCIIIPIIIFIIIGCYFKPDCDNDYVEKPRDPTMWVDGIYLKKKNPLNLTTMI